MNNKKSCIVDRFEGDWVVVEYGRETFNFPKALVGDVKEGDVLEFVVKTNNSETNTRKKNIEDLAKKLFK